MPKTRELRAIRTKQLLRDTMNALIKTRDFELITANEICRAAAVSRSTFYIHYEDKFDLMVDCISQQVSHPFRLNGDAGLEAYFAQMLGAVRRNHVVIRRLLQISDTMELKRRMDQLFLHEYKQYFTDKYPAGNPHGISPDMLAVYHCYGIMEATILWLKQEYPTPVPVLAVHMAEQLRRA